MPEEEKYFVRVFHLLFGTQQMTDKLLLAPLSPYFFVSKISVAARPREFVLIHIACYSRATGRHDGHRQDQKKEHHHVTWLMLLRLQHSKEFNPFSWNSFHFCNQRLLQEIHNRSTIYGVSLYTMGSIIVLPFQTTPEMNPNYSISLIFPGKPKISSFTIPTWSLYLDMVDSVTFLVKAQKNLKI